MSNQGKLPHIVVVGGGAGGMELVARLGRTLGKKKQALITLVDSSPTHVWKPLLHEVAAGTLDSSENEIDYLGYAATHHFRFILGSLQNLDRTKKEILLAPLYHQGREILPQRSIPYDILVIAVGSVANDYNIPGARENCLFLDDLQQAEHFHQVLLNHFLRMSHQLEENKNFHISVVGGGATGIELITELHSAVNQVIHYGLNIQSENISFSLIEGAQRLLTALPERVATLVTHELNRLGIKIYLEEQVDRVTPLGFHTKSGQFIPADIKIWTAGIKAPEFLRYLDGLEVNRMNQLLVKPTLQTTKDDAIFAFGDCASCPQEGRFNVVPPRAQAAHQQAKFLVKTLKLYLEKKSLPFYHYHDYGSLVTLSHYQVIGNLMGKITKSLMIEGKLARFFYLSLFKQHQVSLYGFWRVLMLTIANSMSRRVRPRLKLH